MNDPKNISIKDYHYELPVERIAKYPLAERDASRLLVYNAGHISESTYAHIADYLPEGAHLFFNNTKVVQARLFFFNSNGGRIEVFCLEPPAGQEVATGMAATSKVRWKCLVGGVSKWKEPIIQVSNTDVILKATIAERLGDSFLIDFEWEPAHLSFAEVLHLSGVIPIPPYLKRNTEEIDLQRYQTVYAREEGSVAAPTAGLHFTERVFTQLTARSIGTSYVTLHVGAGTFMPVKADVMADHEMHYEFIDVQRAAIEELLKLAKNEQQMIVAVGTTSLRTLESLYWIGAGFFRDPGADTSELPELYQWTPYEADSTSVTVVDALTALLDWMTRGNHTQLIARTGIIIAPGYQLKIAKGLVTNFHQPESTLMLLVAAVAGNDWKRIYQYALEHDFRFLSYGDGSLIIPA